MFPFQWAKAVSMAVARFNAYGVSVAGAVQRFKDSRIQQFDNLKI
jgi:hypothetical protein